MQRLGNDEKKNYRKNVREEKNRTISEENMIEVLQF